MASSVELKSRLKAVKNTSLITKAMEVVAATKMRKAQERALGSRPYAFTALEMLQTALSLSQGKSSSPFFSERPVNKTLLVIVASDRGLAGAFNSQVFRTADQFLANDINLKNSDHRLNVIAIGKKAKLYAHKNKLEVIADFEHISDFISPEQVSPIANRIVHEFAAERADRVVTIATNFRSALKQEPLVRNLLPLSIDGLQKTVSDIVPEHGRFSHLKQELANKPAGDYIFEPNPEQIITELVPHLVKMQLYHLILEANASEHSARRLAMKNASDNAIELKDDLTLEYNKSRQAGITKEIIEITSTQSALT